jgi:hypothetical protein
MPKGIRIVRDATLKDVALGLMRVSEIGQRHLNQARVDYLTARMDVEEIETPTVNFRDGYAYIINGQHRIRALLASGFTEDDTIQCWTYNGLSEEEEANKFLLLADVLTVDGFDRFRIAVNAGWEEETDINRIILAADLRVSREGVPGAVRCVGTVRRIYRRAGPKALARTLAIARDAYGDPGMEAIVLDGIGLVVGRYEGKLDDKALITKLSRASGGARALANKAEIVKQQTSKPKAQCVAAVIVETYNSGRTSVPRLTKWWKSGQTASEKAAGADAA